MEKKSETEMGGLREERFSGRRMRVRDRGVEWRQLVEAVVIRD